MSNFNKLANLHNVFFKQSEGIDPRVAEAKAQRDAIRKSLDVTGPGGGTTQGHVRSDGKGGWTVSPGAQYTPQKAITIKAIKFQILYLEQAVRQILLQFLEACSLCLNLLTLG